MTAPIVQSTQQIPPASQKTTKTSIFYINDVHQNIINMERLKSASDKFDAFIPSDETDKLKFSAGDISVGKNATFSKLAVAFQNAIGTMASAAGNHEFDLNKKDLAVILEDAQYKLLGLNKNLPSDSEENRRLKEKILQSYIQEQNGTKYGVIGLLPYDFLFHTTEGSEYKDLDVFSIEKTISVLQQEIDKMKQQGINKIIVLSHGGYTADVQLARSVEGIDVILGGHTHDLIKDIKEGKNLFYSKKTGEPTIITQAGKDGRYFGILNLEFNEKGVITKAQNNVCNTEDFPRNFVMKHTTDNILGKAKVIGYIKSAPKHEHTLISESPSINLMMDAVRNELDVDIAMTNAGNIRSSLEAGPVTDRDLQTLTPFHNKLCIIKLTEKELIDMLNIGAKSFASVDKTPGIAHLSGLKYTISKSNASVKDAVFISKDGKETPIDVLNPNPFKTYTVALDDFVAKGGNNYIPNKYDSAIAVFDFDKTNATMDYIKKQNKPIDIKFDGRVQIVD